MARLATLLPTARWFLDGREVAAGECDCDIVAATERHDRVAPGTLFAARPGKHRHGEAFVPAALEAGAAAILADRPQPSGRTAVVPNVPEALGPLVQHLAGWPSRTLPTFGVTGTDGKTTTTHWLAALLSDVSSPRPPAALIGTVENRIGHTTSAATYTTPPAEELAALLAAAREAGCPAAVVELSSQGLEQRRADGITLAGGIWTTFGRDHLDDHASPAAYFAAKAHLLSLLAPGAPLVVAPDLVSSLRPLAVDCDLHVARFTTERSGSTGQNEGQVVTCGPLRFWLPVAGVFNAANAAAAATLALALGRDRETIVQTLETVTLPRGRLMRVPLPAGQGGPYIVVDYAHTPAALAAVTETLAEQAAARAGRLFVVVGAGGDRDAGKRPLMGAALVGDHVWLTSDNPRGEASGDIAAAIAAGLRLPSTTQLDRALAIAEAIAAADERDVVLIAGKGHERSQTIGGRSVPFDDAAIAAAALATRAAPPHCERTRPSEAPDV